MTPDPKTPSTNGVHHAEVTIEPAASPLPAPEPAPSLPVLPPAAGHATKYRIGLRTFLADGRRSYVSRWSHTTFHATDPDNVEDALTFADPGELKKWISEQNAAVRRDLKRFHACPVAVADQGVFDAATSTMLADQMTFALQEGEAKDRADAEAKLKARKGAAVA